MCGIAGIIAAGDTASKAPAIRRMTDAMAHRGSNAERHFVDDHVAIGHRRLAIIDLSPEANQPFWDHAGRYAIAFNGELYNFKQIRQELAGYPSRMQRHTEVGLAAYIH